MVFKLMYVVTYFFGMFYINNYMSAFLGTTKTQKWIYYLSHLLYPGIVCTLYFTINIPILNLIGNLAAIWLISLNYDTGMLKKILFSVFLYIFMMLIEVGTAFSTGYLGVSVLEKGTYSQTFGLIAVAMILYTISLICKKIQKHKKDGRIKFEEWIAVLLIPVLSLCLIVILVESENMNKLQGVVAIAAIFAINIIIFYLYEDLQESYKSRLEAAIFLQEKEYYYNQCRYMEASAESARSFRHDTRNHLFTISEIIKKGNTEEAQAYIHTIVNKRLSAEVAFSDTGNIAIDSVINYKLNEARNNGINIKANISVPNNLLLDAADITAIVGNLIDNSIEACMRLKKEKRQIDVSICYEKGILFIGVKNTFDGELEEGKGKPVTRKSDKLNHGYGLRNVEKTLEKYDGYMELEYDEHWFTVSAMMYVKAIVSV